MENILYPPVPNTIDMFKRAYAQCLSELHRINVAAIERHTGVKFTEHPGQVACLQIVPCSIGTMLTYNGTPLVSHTQIKPTLTGTTYTWGFQYCDHTVSEDTYGK